MEFNGTNGTVHGPTVFGPKYVLVSIIFAIGIVGNIAALWILHRSSKLRNRKHVLMLRALAANDLIATTGMLITITLQRMNVLDTKIICIAFVVLRDFGIGSGCISFVMAFERWLALTRPFVYQQFMSHRKLMITILLVWSAGAFVTNLPLVGFGLYYTKYANGTDTCTSYREAINLDDHIYSYIFFAFGTLLCLCIAYCNMRVIFELLMIRSHGRILVRRVSRSIINNRSVECKKKYQTPEEVAFAKLMATISIIFVVCWAPQMISIPLYHYHGYNVVPTRLLKMLMSIYLTLDPYIYVLQHYWDKKWLFLPCWFKPRSTSSLPTPTTTTTLTPTTVLLQAPTYPNLEVM